jgi:hypothetical protein
VLSSLLYTVAWAAFLPADSEAGTISKSAADDLAAKIAMLSDRRSRLTDPLDPVTITDQEANSYLKYRGHEFLPPALHNPEVHILSDHLSGAANVNFDELGATQNKSDDLTSRMMAYVFTGTQRVTATGTLETQNGEGKFALTGLTVGSTSLPPAFVTFLLQSYLEKQYKIDISKPFPLPANVTRIDLAPGRATLRRIALSRR